ncbi:interactor of constitutive active ROPs 2, chloroplastic-like [Silene latifolia]|uniref:interactor of constitutive active ROPs 2, chloroplastic-like n=1 Tax=Silene latifolia TaxID=37657 RepID=UPI003D7754B2
MQTPKARNGSAEVSQRLSASTQTFQKSSPSTNRTNGQIKVAVSGSDSAAFPNSSSRTPRNRSPKVLERGSPRSPMTEKKRLPKLSDLESQLAQLEVELKKTKTQLNSSEAQKQRAMQEREEMKKQLVVMSTRLEEYQQQLDELSVSDDTTVKELQKLSQERDRVWQSELEAIQVQHSMDSAALASALNEIQKLKKQLEMVAESETAQTRHAEKAHEEIENLRGGLSETVLLVENMRKQLSDCKGSEIRALQVARESQMQLEEAMTIAVSLRSEGLKAKETYNGFVLELEKSKEQASSLEVLVKELEEKLQNRSRKNSLDKLEEIMPEADGGRKKELEALKLEVGKLRSALEASELRYQEEYIQSTLQIRNAFDQVERVKLETSAREADLEAELKKARSAIEELKLQLMIKDTVIQNSSAHNMGLKSKIEENETCTKKSEAETDIKTLKGDLQDLKAVLMDKETQIQNTINENEMLKAEIEKRVCPTTKVNGEVAESAEAARAAEREALLKLRYLTEEADKSCREAVQVAEQLDATRTANIELEAELRKLKVQSDQWRKAAEAAAVMLSTGSNGKFLESSVPRHSTTSKLDIPLSDDVDDDSPKKKNGNVLKKIGLWKKGQK